MQSIVAHCFCEKKVEFDELVFQTAHSSSMLIQSTMAKCLPTDQVSQLV